MGEIKFDNIFITLKHPENHSFHTVTKHKTPGQIFYNFVAKVKNADYFMFTFLFFKL